jgi:membrane associated rhomboid family serine protease
MKEPNNISIKNTILFPAAYVGLLWGIKIAESLLDISLVSFGIFPREAFGLFGILMSPLIHSDFNHLLSNTFPLLFLLPGIIYFYPKSSAKVICSVYFFTGLLVWLFARSAFHIGSSGLIYGFVTFLFFSGIIRRDNRSIALSLIVTFLYGSLIWGILPTDEGISWESHLYGAIVGIILAFILRKKDPSKKYDWEDEPEEIPPHKLEISYDKGYPFDEKK